MSIKYISKICGSIILSLFLWAGVLFAQDSSEQVIHAGRNTSVQVPIYKSRVIVVPAPIKRVSVGNPDIADVLVLGADDLYILGKDLGSTNVLLWDKNDVLISSLQVSITHDLEGLRHQLLIVLPDEKIGVSSVQRDLVLSGRLTNVMNMDAALKVANSFLEQAATAKEKIMFSQQKTGATGDGASADKRAGQVINLMTIGGRSQQVMLQVKVAEVNRDAVKNMNAQMNAMKSGSKVSVGAVNGGATFPEVVFADGLNHSVLGTQMPWGPAVNSFTPNMPSIANTGIFASYLGSGIAANIVLDAYQDKGLAKILAEPTLTTLSGQDAQFLSGGSFPIPVSTGNNAVGIEFKDYGVKLQFLPLVLDGDRINLKLNISVSELGQSSALKVAAGTTALFNIPSLTERRAMSTVELLDGQSISIAGLMNENMRTSISKFPWLGDVPILGALFRSQQFQKGQTELMIIVTATLAKPMVPGDIKLPTDSVIEPTDNQFFFGGEIEGSTHTTPATQSTDASAK